MNNIVVTTMTIGMLEECVDLFIDVFTREPWNDVYESRDQVKRFFENHFNNNYFLGYVAIVDKEIIALSLGMRKPWIEGMEYYIDEFCVSAKMQRSGVGSQFMKLIEIDLKAKNLNSVLLLTDKYYPSHQFYEKVGYRVVEDTIVMFKGM
ncbi:GNAT superfamily N-acetyltransferase [Paenibacillus castaneae]|uniref:GNAT family N-acetyltransferase n=1 Tax=Paenibacillus castaneae TaxID=474957 RepID=UPI000C998B27|nr:GNAT family N-acetyltransferase [Paenibacillus castaneae]NIK76805.1 GNAT superfamily N-acetyltransferase [Paenibacillus castaneae]